MPEALPSPCDNFRRQHAELMEMAGGIVRLLVPARLEASGADVRIRIARFGGKLVVHATMENEALYPRLLQHPDPQVRARARMLFDDVKRIYDSWEDYARTWREPGAIERDPARFIGETQDVLRTLGRRMHRENGELYPMVDDAAA